MKKHILSLFLLFSLLVGAQSAFGLSYFWKGGASGVWDNAANWVTGSLGGPVATHWPGDASNGTTGVPVTFSTAANITFASTQTVSIQSLTIIAITVSLNTGASTITATSSISVTTGGNFFVTSSNLTTGSFTTQGVFEALVGSTINVSNYVFSSHNAGYQTIIDASTLAVASGLNSQNTFKLQNGSTLTLQSASLNSSGSFTCSGSSTITASGSLTNSGTFTSTSCTITSNGSFANNGTFSGTTTIFNNNGLFDNYSSFSLINSTFNNPSSIVTNDSATPAATFTLTNSTLALTGGEFDNFGSFSALSGSIISTTGSSKLNNESSGSSILTSSTINLGTGTFLENYNSVTANTTTFNLVGNGSAGGGARILNDGTNFSSTSCIFNLGLVSTDIDTYIVNTNNAATVFTDNGSTFNIVGDISVSGSGGYTSIQNDGNFFALSGSKFFLKGANTTIVNGSSSGNYTGGPCYFVLGAKSAIVLGTNGSSTAAVGSEVNNDGTAFGSGPFTYNQFIFNSDKDNSATFINYNWASNSGATGNFYVQRFITGGAANLRSYRLLSSPVNNGSNLIDFSYLNATFTPGYTSAPTYNGIYTGGAGGVGSGFSFNNSVPLMYVYKETLNPQTPLYSYTTGKNEGITSVAGTTLGTISTANPTVGGTGPGPTVTGTATLAPGNGYQLYYLNSTATPSIMPGAPDNATISYYGGINQGDVPVSLWYAPNGGGTLSYSSGYYSAGFNMIGNPYPSTIDLNLLYYTNSIVGGNTYNTFYELDDVSNHYYSYIPSNGTANGGGATSGGNVSEYVASGQGFFVLTTTGNQSLTFKETQKVYNTALLTQAGPKKGLLVAQNESGSAPSTKAIIQGSENQLVAMHLKLKLDSANYDETGIYFYKDGVDKYDHNDAVYLPGIGTKVSFSSYTSDGVNVGINSMGNYLKGKRIKLDVESSTDGLFSLSISDISNIDPTIFNVFLIDNYKKDSVDFVKNPSYSFNVLIADGASYGPGRFVLAVERKPLGAYQLVTLKGSKSNSGVSVTWKTNNEGDFTGFGLQKLDPATNKYVTVDSLQSNGSSNYTYDDPATITGVNTYRLEQNDIDGNVTYSNPITVNYTLVASPGSLSVYPNPVKDAIVVDFSGVAGANAESYNIEIYNSLGVLIIQKNSGSNSVTEDVSTLKPGVYIVNVKTNYGTPVGSSTFVKNQ